jgi:hypothetical protein
MTGASSANERWSSVDGVKSRALKQAHVSHEMYKRETDMHSASIFKAKVFSSGRCEVSRHMGRLLGAYLL